MTFKSYNQMITIKIRHYLERQFILKHGRLFLLASNKTTDNLLLYNITIYVCKSILCVHAAVPAAYSMLLYNESVSVVNVALYFYNTSYNMVAIIFTAFKSFLFSLFRRVD